MRISPSHHASDSPNFPASIGMSALLQSYDSPLASRMSLPCRPRRMIQRLAIGLFIVLSVILTETSVDAKEFAAEYTRDFQSEGFDNRALSPLGPGATSLIRPAHEGLLVTVPSGHEIRNVGFSPRFKVRGDFEITVGFEVVSWEKPRKGLNVGPALYIVTPGEGDPAAEIGRLHTGNDQAQIYSTFSRAFINGAAIKSVPSYPATAMQGQLRLRREGNQLHFEVRDDLLDESFRSLRSTEFSTDELQLVRVAVNRNDHDVPVRVLFKSLSIRADELPHLPSDLAESTPLYRAMYHPPPPETDWRRVIVFSSTAALLLAGGIVWLVRRGRR